MLKKNYRKIGKKKSDVKVEGSGEIKCERNEKCWRKCKC